MKVIIIGGVAGGASCATRLRRLDEKAEILMFERGPYVSYANCALPYYIGGVIEEESALFVASERYFRNRFAIDVYTRCEAIEIFRNEKTVKIRDLETGQTSNHSYDKLVLSPGATSVHPPLLGIDLPGIFHVRTVPDALAIRKWIQQRKAILTETVRKSRFQQEKAKAKAVVVGGGFIGLEMVENLIRQDFDLTLVEMLDQVLPPIDPEQSRVVEAHLKAHGVNLVLNDGVAEFKQADAGRIEVKTKSGKNIVSDIVILALGIRPDVNLAKKAGLVIGERGGIRVDEHMRTSDPDIFAVGDAVEVKDFVTGEWTLIPLAGPANRQGRIAAEVIAGRDSGFRGTQGTAVIGVFGKTIAWTGINEKTLLQRGETDYEKIFIYPNSHAGYYPGAKPITLKVIFRRSDGRLLGVCAFGEEGVDKRVDVFAAMIQMGATIYDLEEAELCYAPQFGSAKDPVNIAGMVAANALRGDMPISHWNSVKSSFLLDVREPSELKQESVPGAVNIPLGQLRSRLDELPPDQEINVFCEVGQRSYYATRILLQNGFNAKDVSGGMKALKQFCAYHSENEVCKKEK